MGASRDSQLRMLRIIKAVVANLHGKKDNLAFGQDVMTAKWRKLNAVVSRSRRISLQKIPAQYCTYFDKIRGPSPPYAWVKYKTEEDGDCSDMLLKAKITTRLGDWSVPAAATWRSASLKPSTSTPPSTDAFVAFASPSADAFVALAVEFDAFASAAPEFDAFVAIIC
ncbi:hypothetical protein ACQ4PT_041324 [Festuca glaucescens]